MDIFLIISKECIMPGDVILDSDLLSKLNAHIYYSINKLSGVTKEVSWSTNLIDNKELINSIDNIEILS